MAKERIRFDLLPQEVKKQLQNNMSWKQFYTILGTKNDEAAKKCQVNIESIMADYNL